MEFEFIKEKVRPIGKNNAYVDVMYQWLESNNKTLKFKCKSEKEMNSITNSAYQFRHKNNLDFTVFKRANLCEVYLVRA